jgi:hypothetical protein
MSHVNARLTVHGRRLIVDRVAAGRPVAHIAAELGVSRQTAYRWVSRFRAEGAAGLADRSSRPKSTPTRTGPDREQAVLDARKSSRFGPLRVAAITGVPARNLGIVGFGETPGWGSSPPPRTTGNTLESKDSRVFFCAPAHGSHFRARRA